MNTDYLVKRLGLFLLILWLASTVNFVLPRLGGQDPIRAQLGAQAAMGGNSQIGAKAMIEEYDRRCLGTVAHTGPTPSIRCACTRHLRRPFREATRSTSLCGRTPST